MTDIQANYDGLQKRIVRACQQAGRDPQEITLVGAAKTKSAAAVASAFSCGVKHFGENYVEEGVAKIQASLALGATWHFIGRIQRNKTRHIASHFDWVHTLDRQRIAERLNEQCPPDKTLQVLIQVNIDNDPAKAGVDPAQAQQLLSCISDLPRLQPRGLMTILAQSSNLSPAQRYRSVAELHQQLSAQLADQTDTWNVLSMGMTGDLEDAISAGATHIRIGTALFGARS